MSTVLAALPIAAAVLASSSPPSREIENVAAFARLYGVVRFFYPSDAAAELDWNRFAVHGVARARAARDARELEATLRRLVAPLGPGLEVGASLSAFGAGAASSEPLVAWRYLGPGFSTIGGPYRAKRTHRAAPTPPSGFVTLLQTVPAAILRGKAIRLTAQARATALEESGGGALWLRVDRPNQVMGFFDNMGNRPIREPEWRPYAIEGTVADDAENVAFGVMAMGAVTADFDAVELAARGTTGDWAPVAIQDAGFEAADAQKSGWLKTGSADAAISRPAAGAPQSGQYVRFAPVPVPAGAADAELFPEGDPAPGAHADVDLGAGLRARVPLVLTDAEARPNPGRQSDLDALRAALAALPGPAAAPDPDQRLADVVVAWNVLRHFYPYWTEAGVDWDAHLQPQLEMARGAETREAQRDAIRRLVADARDGHGLVLDTLDTTQRAELPVRLAVIEDRLVVVSSARPSEVGAVVSTIDGVPATERLARAVSLASGTTQWRQVAGIRPLTSGPVGTTVRLGLDTGSGTQEVELTYLIPPPPVKRPGPVVAKEPGLWYVDLTRARMAQITWKLAAIAAARAVVFDVRGYPTDAGFGILPHLLDAPETDRWMHVAKIVGPFHETAGWQDEGWNVKPASPRIAGQVVFLTDGGAISYAESVMGYVADRKLGTIVGGPTAGTNGNVASFVTPGGFAVNFTGMRVTRHDGRSPHHLVGVRPDVPVAPTLEGLRAGRDEVLERGLAVAAAGATAR